jgi:hypothetical protein
LFINFLGSWILISFKREFPFEDVLRLWEVLWTDYYTNGMVLFVSLAVLESHRDVMLRYLVEFDEILKVRALSVSSSSSFSISNGGHGPVVSTAMN